MFDNQFKDTFWCQIIEGTLEQICPEIIPKFEEREMNWYCHHSAVNKSEFLGACKNLSKASSLAMLENPR